MSNPFPRDPLNTRIILPKEAYLDKLSDYQKQLQTEATMFASRNYQGHMNYDVAEPFLEALTIASKFNQNNVAVESSGPTTAHELKLVHAMKEMVGYETTAWGYCSVGGTISNLEALWIARSKTKENNRKIVITSELGHYSIQKACFILGLNIRICDVDKEGRIILPVDLREVLAIVVNVGDRKSVV